MASARLRLILASVLFALWMGYLGWLVWANARPHVRLEPDFEIAKSRYEVMSRSQLLAADLDVSVMVDDQGNVTEIRDLLWARDGKESVDLSKLNIKRELETCELTGRGPFLVPLVQQGDGFAVARVPDMPGLRRDPTEFVPQERTDKRVYHDTSQTRDQEREIRKRY
jgi:hypothetical protein